MTRAATFSSLLLSALMLVPVAYATLHQAVHIVA